MSRAKLLTIAYLLAILCAPAGRGVMRPADAPRDARIVLATFFAEFLPGLRSIEEDFEAETGIALEVQGVPYQNYELWLHARFLGRNAPEVLLLENPAVAWRYGQAGMMLPFDEAVNAPNPLAESTGPWRDAFRKPHIQQSLDPNGRLYLIPYTQYGVGFFYNRDQYAACGLRPPDTWAGLLANMDTLQENGYTAYITAVKPDDAQTVWIASMLLECFNRVHVPEVNLVTNDPAWRFDFRDRSCTVDERVDVSERIVAFERGIIDPARSPEFRAVARIVKNMSRRWRPDFLSLSGEEIYKVFANGGTAHMMNGTWFIGEFAQLQETMARVAPDNVFEYGLFPFPDLRDTAAPLVRAGGVNQNAGMRACLMVSAQREPWREKAGVLLCHYLTLPRVMEKILDHAMVYDIPAIEAVPPKPKAAELLPKEQFAYLPVAAFTGYDAQALSEFWALWQGWLGDTLSLDAFLEKLSASHRESLARQAVIYRDELRRDFLREQLGPETEWAEL